VLSVFTHELNNHLAIIKESAGLIEDTLRLQKSSGKYDIEESLKIIQSIENQIGKTAWICKKLNGFGHRMDRALSTFNVNESLEELLVLLNRVANQKRVSFEKDFDEDMPQISSDPAKLQFIVFCLIEKGLNRLDRDSSIVLKTAQAGGSIKISIIPKGNFIESDERGICSEEIVQYVGEQLGGSISMNAEDKEITITLPVQVSPKNSDRGEKGVSASD
jgi:C4-dicarboxylate-specific signal transduction histidine kinase